MSRVECEKSEKNCFRCGARAGANIAVNCYENDQGHKLVETARPMWKLTATPTAHSIEELAENFMTNFMGVVYKITKGGNGGVYCPDFPSEADDPVIPVDHMDKEKIGLYDIISFQVGVD